MAFDRFNNTAKGFCGPGIVEFTGVDQNATDGRVGGWNYGGDMTIKVTSGRKVITPPLGVGRISAACLGESRKTLLVIEDKAPDTRYFKAYDAVSLTPISEKEGCNFVCMEEAGVKIAPKLASFDPPID
ncbi:hypothetical protein NIPOLPBK_00942 [Stenotrophomonas maltophilia]|nr:hypothetical protein NIPOLPBK_00942 [Stenotrophomonas maltophilia]WBL68897.1 hypothetical protein SMAL454_27400 [Stenotrophomonas maltophilia]